MAKPKQQVKPKFQKEKKPSENTIVCEAIVKEVLPSGTFKVKLKDFDSDELITVKLGGRVQLNHIKIIKNDHVKVELSTYDLSKGRIIFRYRTPPVIHKNEENEEK